MKTQPACNRFFAVLLFTLLTPLVLWAGPGDGTSYTPYRLDFNVAKNGQTLGYLQSSVISYSFQWTFVFTVNRGLGRDIMNSSFRKWMKNVSTLPEIPDGDHWITNFIGHPLLGASVFAFYRNRGFSNQASVAGTLLQSTLFEYTVEGWKQPPSGIDLIVTPVLGSLIGSQVGMNSFILSSSYALTKYIFGLF
ncbi:MAG TPA: DUF3943 domain-containing protein [bacterium]